MKFQAVSSDQIKAVETGQQKNAPMQNLRTEAPVPKRFPAAFFPILDSFLTNHPRSLNFAPQYRQKSPKPWGEKRRKKTSGIMYSYIYTWWKNYERWDDEMNNGVSQSKIVDPPKSQFGNAWILPK